MCIFLFRVIFNFQGCDSLLESEGSTSGAEGVLPAKAGGPFAPLTQGNMHSMYRLRGGGIFTVLDSVGGRKKNKDVFSALLRLLESDWFKSDVSKISLPSVYGMFQT